MIVDKTVPRIDACEATVRGDQTLQLRWAATDAHLNDASWRIEVQTEGATTWETVALAKSGSGAASRTDRMAIT